MGRTSTTLTVGKATSPVLVTLMTNTALSPGSTDSLRAVLVTVKLALRNASTEAVAWEVTLLPLMGLPVALIEFTSTPATVPSMVALNCTNVDCPAASDPRFGQATNWPVTCTGVRLLGLLKS